MILLLDCRIFRADVDIDPYGSLYQSISVGEGLDPPETLCVRVHNKDAEGHPAAPQCSAQSSNGAGGASPSPTGSFQNHIQKPSELSGLDKITQFLSPLPGDLVGVAAKLLTAT